MPRQHRSFLALLVLAAVLTVASSVGAGYRRIHAPILDDPMGAQIFELDNGLTVYLTENHETPRFYAEIAVRAGSKNDPPVTTGLAHYMEHLLFKGTIRIGTLDYEKEKPHLDRIAELYEQHFHESDPKKRKAIYAEINRETQLSAKYVIPNELDKVYKAMGATGLNAHTWHEETVYKVNLPSNRLRQWAAIESERFQAPMFRLFQSELEIVYEEKNRTLDNKDRLVQYAVAEVLYKKHPYGQQPTIGKVAHLKNPSIDKVYGFFDTYYVPNNMAVLISGDIDVDETIKIVDEHFSVWKRKELPEHRTWSEDPLSGAERVTVKYQGEEYVLLAFRTAHQNHPDAEALKLLDMILDNRTAGLINLNLNQKQRVRSAGSHPWMLNDFGAQYLWGVPKKGQTLQEVEQLLQDQIDQVKKGEFEEWILSAIVTDFEKHRKAEMESDGGRVGTMRKAYLAYKEWDEAVREIARMEMISKEDIIRAANTYFGDGYVAGYRVDAQHEVPKLERPEIDKIDIDPSRQSEFAKGVLEMPVDPIEPTFVDPEKDYQKIDYHGGVKLYYSKNPINDLFSLSITVETGNNQDNRMGIATMLLDKSGTPTHIAEDLKKEWYKLGTDFSIGAGKDETTISIAGLDENFDASLALMMKILRHPTADKPTLDELVKIILAQREDTKRNYRAIRGGVVLYNRYGKQSRHLRELPNEDVQKLTVEELHGVIRNLLGYKHTISYTGSLPLERVLSALKASHPVSGALLDPPPYLFLKARAPEENEVLFFHKEIAQSQVVIEFGGEDYSEAHVPAVQLYNQYFGGGMGGLVFQELREARALAYGVWSRYHPGGRKGDQNMMWGAIQCQPDKTPEALDTFIDLLDNLPVSPDRFQEARQSMLNQYRTSKLGFRGVLGAVRSWERLGVPVDPRRTRFERIGAADMDLMLNFHREHLNSRPKLISIVGDSSRIDMERLARSGKIVEVGLGDIFVY